MSCNVTLTDKINLKNQSKNSFSSEEEFDTWLYQNRVEISQQAKNPKVKSATYAIAVSPIDSRIAAWDRFRANIQEVHNHINVDASEVLGDGFGKLIKIGTTTLFGIVGNANDISKPVNDFDEFDPEKLKEKLRSEGLSETDINKELSKRQRLSTLKKIDGNIFGALVEDALLGTTQNIDALRSHKSLNSNLKSVGLTFDQAISRVDKIAKNAINKIKDEIRNRHGSGAKIYTEVEVISKSLSSDMKSALRTACAKLGKNENANAVQGFIDIVVQDSSGQLHTYDIKVSGHHIADWWAGTGSNWKYNEVSAQQMAYATMARQWGINFNTIGIIPAYIEYDEDGNVKSLESENFKEFSLTNQYALACERYFPVHTKTDSGTIRALSQLTEELYPGLQLSTAVKTMEMNKDFVIRNIVGNKKSDGKYHLPIDDDEHSLIGKEMIFDDKESLEKYIEDEYLPKINAKYTQELRGLAKSLRNISNTKRGSKAKTEQLYEMASGFSKNKDTQDWIVNKFKKYAIQDGWDLVSDDDNLLADYGIFVFIRNGLAEIVMIDQSDLYGVVEIGRTKNTTVLGNLRHDLSKGMDDLNVMKSLRGNLLLMKAMAFISQNEGSIFNGVKVQAVRALNLRWNQEINEATGKLMDNWNQLAALYNIKYSGEDGKSTLRTITESTMLPSGLAFVQRANDIVETFLDSKVHFKEHKNYLSTFTDDDADDILRYIRNLQAGSNIRVENSANWRVHSDEFEAYKLLLQAYLAVRGFIISAQNGIGDYVSNGFFLTGARSSSPAESNSPALRLFNQIDSTYEQKLRTEYSKIVQPWQSQMLKVYEENNIDLAWGGNERDLFKMCFERDEKGNITSDFCLIPPEYNPFFANGQHPELKKLVQMFLRQINEIRIPDENEREALAMKRNSIYYQVPLTNASTIQQVKQGGVWNTIKAKTQAVFDEVKVFAYGKPMSNFEIKQFKSIDREQVYDPYLSTSQEAQDFRHKQLSENEIVEEEDGKKNKRRYRITDFETSLDTVFLKSMASALRTKISQDFMPLFTGLRAILAYNANIEGAELDSIRTAIDDFIKSAVFGKSLIQPEYQKLNEIIKILRNITSTTALAFNMTSFTREQLTSALRTSFNKSIDPLMKGEFTEKEYMDSILNIIMNCKDNVDVLSFYSQLNFAYGLANVSQEQLAEANKTGFLNMNNWTSNLLFMTSTSPDFVHRNAILCAILKHRGSYDAYSLNENKELVYDMSKDKFYEVYWKYKDRYSEIPDRATREMYKKQEAYYLGALNDWNKRYGMNLKPGDALPHALSPTEANGIRVYADHMFGNYDANTKSLMQKGMVGGLIFQFKTYSISRFLQAFRDKGTINVTRQRIMQTDNGDEIYEVLSIKPDEWAKYGGRYFKKKSELTEEELSRARPIVQMAGSETGGIIGITVESVRDFLFDRDRFIDNWKNSDVYKANLYISLIDNLGMLIIAMLLKLLYGEETVNDLYNQDWWTRWTYTVLMGVAQDGPIDQVVGGIVGDGTPPSFAIIKSFYRNAFNIITGEDSAMYGFMNTFGATRQFAGMFNNMR